MLLSIRTVVLKQVLTQKSDKQHSDKCYQDSLLIVVSDTDAGSVWLSRLAELWSPSLWLMIAWLRWELKIIQVIGQFVSMCALKTTLNATHMLSWASQAMWGGGDPAWGHDGYSFYSHLVRSATKCAQDSSVIRCRMSAVRTWCWAVKSCQM